MDAKDTIALFGLACTTMLAVLAQGIAWTRESAVRSLIARTEHELFCTFFGGQGGFWIVEIAVTVRNVGTVTQRYRRIRLRLNGLRKDDAPTLARVDAEKDMRIALAPLAQVELIPKPAEHRPPEYLYVAAGTTQRFTAMVRIPADTTIVVARAYLTAHQEEGISRWPFRQAPRYDLDFEEERAFRVHERPPAPITA